MIHLLGLALFSGVLGSSVAVDKRRKNKKEQALAVAPTGQQDSTPSTETALAVVVNPEKAKVAAVDKAELDRNLVYSGIALGMSVFGSLYYAPLSLASLIPLAISAKAPVKLAYDYARKGEINIIYLDVFAIFMGVGTGVFMLSAMTQTLYFTSNKLLLKTRNQAEKKLSEIFVTKNQQVWVLHDDTEVATPLEQVRKGDQVVLNTGEIVPIDGVIVSGIATVDQHMLTGEAQPEEKTVGDKVFATTLLIAGRIVVAVEQAGGNTIASNIAKALDNTDAYITELDTRSEQAANKTFWPTIAGGGTAWLVRGSLMSGGLALSSNFLEVLRIGQPIMTLNYLRIASEQGILVKDGRSLEQMSTIDTVVFDKTGTLTQEQPHVERVLPMAGFSEEQVIYFAAAAEYRQTHPIARAILDEANKRNITLATIDDAKYQLGFGLHVILNNQAILVGSRRYMELEGIELNELIPAIEAEAHKQANSILYIAVDGKLCGLIELAPTLRPESLRVVSEFKQRGIKVIIVSGDHEEPVRRLAEGLGIDEYVAQALPEDKAALIEKMQTAGRRVCFVGDGINDSIALKKAAVSVSVSEGSDIARESAQVVLISGSLLQLLDLLDVSIEFKRQQKLGIATGTIPSIGTLGGVIFMGFGMGQIMLFYTLSALASVSTAMVPLLRNRTPTKLKKTEKLLTWEEVK